MDLSTIAYFSMEVGVEPTMHTYSGGPGVLAGDTIRSAADLQAPMPGVTLLYRKGHFHQTIDTLCQQHEETAEWSLGPRDDLLLRYALNIREQEILEAHKKAKRELILHTNRATGFNTKRMLLEYVFKAYFR